MDEWGKVSRSDVDAFLYFPIVLVIRWRVGAHFSLAVNRTSEGVTAYMQVAVKKQGKICQKRPNGKKYYVIHDFDLQIRIHVYTELHSGLVVY